VSRSIDPLDPIDKVLDALKTQGCSPRRKKTGEGWVARCPVPGHGRWRGDRNPSLTLAEGADRQALLCCHAGCETEAVVEALGLHMADLFPGGSEPRAKLGRGAKAPKGELVATYRYKRRDGSVAFEVLRYAPKDFRQRRPDPKRPGDWIWNLSGLPEADRYLPYRLPELIEAAAPDGAGLKELIIAEGEKDCDELWRNGFVATCNAGGAGKWRDEHSRRLLQDLPGIGMVWIVADRDDPGHRHARQVDASLRRCGYKGPVELLTPSCEHEGGPVCKDASDLVAAHGEDWWRFLDQLPDEPVESSSPGSRAPLPWVRGTDVAIERTEWAWGDRIPRRALTLLIGREGIGKSTLALWVAAQITRGTLPGDLLGHPGDVLVASSEDDIASTLLPRFLAAGGDPARIRFLTQPLTLPGNLDKLKATLCQEHRLVIVDPLSAALGGGRIDTHKDSDVRSVLGHLTHLAAELDLAVLAIGHWNKGMSGEPLDRVLGSRAFTAAARSVLVMGVADHGGGLAVAVAKLNLGVRPPTLACRVQSASVTSRDGTKIATSTIEWLGETTLTAADLLRGPDAPGEASGPQLVAETIRSLLLERGATSPATALSRNELVEALGERGDEIPERTLARALKRAQSLGVHACRSGFPSQSFYWVPNTPDSSAWSSGTCQAL